MADLAAMSAAELILECGGPRQLTQRYVNFECDHEAWRIARGGRSLKGELLSCHLCKPARMRRVLEEGRAITFALVRTL